MRKTSFPSIRDLSVRGIVITMFYIFSHTIDRRRFRTYRYGFLQKSPGSWSYAVSRTDDSHAGARPGARSRRIPCSIYRL